MPSFRTSSDVSFSKITLPCPIFAAEFDPYNRGYLVVGGGGGESKTGVANQISVLDVSDAYQITKAVDIELSRDEDSVQSLASLSTKDGLVIFAGINASMKEQNDGKNGHLRSFSVKCPPRKRQKTEEPEEKEAEKGSWELLGKRSLFKTSTAVRKETYQRLLRLSPSRQRESGSSRIGATATGMAAESEIVVFDATKAVPEAADVLTKIDLAKGEEANDLDIVETEEGNFSLVYCTDHEVKEQTYSYDFKSKTTEKTPNGPRTIYSMPVPDEADKSKTRSTFRSIRFLNSQNVITLLNRPKKQGAELQAFHLYPTGPAMQVQQKSLPSRIKQAVSMDICALNADKHGDQQFVVAIAGQDVSIEIYTLDYSRKTDTLSNLKGFFTMKDVHEHQMTKICWSTFHTPAPPPAQAIEGRPPRIRSPGQQYIRLASVSMGNTVAVDAFPIASLNETDKSSRYVLVHPRSISAETWRAIAIGAVLLAGVAFLIQTIYVGSGKFVTEFGKSSRPAWMPKAAISRPQVAIASATERLHSLLSEHGVEHPTALVSNTPQQTAIVLGPNTDGSGVALNVHSDKVALL